MWHNVDKILIFKKEHEVKKSHLNTFLMKLTINLIIWQTEFDNDE